MRGKLDREGRPVARDALGDEPPPVVLDDAVGDGQAQPRILVGAFVEKNGWKMRGRMSAGIPGPVSATLRRTRESCTLRPIAMRGAEVTAATACSALITRLSTTCSSCPRVAQHERHTLRKVLHQLDP